MDAVEYLKEYERMCRSFRKGCEGCGIRELGVEYEGCTSIIKRYPEEVVAVVERWSAEHQIKTRQSKLLELFPNARKEGAVVAICPKAVEKDFECNLARKTCAECAREYWLSEEEDAED